MSEQSKGSDALFVSHAAVDKDVAAYLKQNILDLFPNTDVFVSSDPEDLNPGYPWMEGILEKLTGARILLVVATERSLSRPLVWFETGAAWAKGLRIVPCCLGRMRKDSLPAPFSVYQALKIDEETDLRMLFDLLSENIARPLREPNFATILSGLARLESVLSARVLSPGEEAILTYLRGKPDVAWTASLLESSFRVSKSRLSDLVPNFPPVVKSLQDKGYISVGPNNRIGLTQKATEYLRKR